MAFGDTKIDSQKCFGVYIIQKTMFDLGVSYLNYISVM